MHWRSFFIGIFSTLIVATIVIVATRPSNAPLESSNDQQTVDETETRLGFTNVYRGTGEKNKDDETPEKYITKIIDSQDALKQVWVTLFKGSLALPLPVVNFEEQNIVIVMSDQKSTEGYQVTIQDMLLLNDSILISIDERQPGQGCNVPERQSRPVHIIRTKILEDLKAELQIKETRGAPCALPLT